MPLHFVPTDLVAQLVERYLSEQVGHAFGGPDVGSATILAERAGLNYDTVNNILVRKRPTVRFDTADRLLCAMNLVQHWNDGILDEHYWPEGKPPDLSKPVKCARRNCEEWFALETIPHENWHGGTSVESHGEPSLGPMDGQRFTTRRYCSKGCAEMERRYKQGQHVPKSKTHYRCGHSKSPENSVKQGKYQRCRTCNIKATQRSREKREAALHGSG